MVEQSASELDMLTLMDSSAPNFRLRPRFSVRTLLIFVTLICIGLGWGMHSRRAHYRQVCVQQLDRVLLTAHWKATQDTENAKELTELLAGDLGSNLNCATIFLRPDGKFTDGTAADSYEQDLLKSWIGNVAPAQGAPADNADRDSSFGNSFVYYKAIRATRICLGCHSTMNAQAAMASGNLGPAPLTEGDLIAIGRVQLAK
jgi:hypothetical protein